MQITSDSKIEPSTICILVNPSWTIRARPQIKFFVYKTFRLYVMGILMLFEKFNFSQISRIKIWIKNIITALKIFHFKLFKFSPVNFFFLFSFLKTTKTIHYVIKIYAMNKKKIPLNKNDTISCFLKITIFNSFFHKFIVTNYAQLIWVLLFHIFTMVNYVFFTRNLIF